MSISEWIAVSSFLQPLAACRDENGSPEPCLPPKGTRTIGGQRQVDPFACELWPYAALCHPYTRNDPTQNSLANSPFAT